jgi:hypothetical protein
VGKRLSGWGTAEVEADFPLGRLVPVVLGGFLGAICKTTRKYQHIVWKELAQNAIGHLKIIKNFENLGKF